MAKDDQLAQSPVDSGQAASPIGEVEAAAGRGGRKIRPAGAGSWLWAMPAILLVVVILYLSIFAGAIYAFTNWTGGSSASFVGLANFRAIFDDPVARKALLNTLWIAFLFVIVTNVLGMLFALGLNRTVRTRYVLRVLVFIPVVLSPLAVAFVWQYIFQAGGPLNELLRAIGLGSWQQAWLASPTFAIYTIIVVLVWQNIGLVMVIYLADLANVSPDTEEAASIDGAGTMRRFWHITLPQLQASVVIVSVLLIIQGLRVFDQVLALTGGGPFNATQTLATEVYQQTFTNGEFGYGAALSLTLTLVVIIVTLTLLGVLRRRSKV